ncbi:MAG: hypothetical protein QG654_405, partial [Patescibacteria group bacterium]|nr:hypothetical protein [Patescibacteria group bacterium]
MKALALFLCTTSSAEPPRPVAKDDPDTHDGKSDASDKLNDSPYGVHQLHKNFWVDEEVENDKRNDGSNEPVAVIHEVAKELVHVDMYRLGSFV